MPGDTSETTEATAPLSEWVQAEQYWRSEAERLRAAMGDIQVEADRCLKTQGSSAEGAGGRYGYGKISNLARDALK